jgi:hypothetical protein
VVTRHWDVGAAGALVELLRLGLVLRHAEAALHDDPVVVAILRALLAEPLHLRHQGAELVADGLLAELATPMQVSGGVAAAGAAVDAVPPHAPVVHAGQRLLRAAGALEELGGESVVRGHALAVVVHDPN